MTQHRALLALVSMLACGPACSVGWRAEFHEPPAEIKTEEVSAKPTPADAPFVKLHTHDGEVYVLERWSFDEAQHQVHGYGLYYSTERDMKGRGEFDVPYERVALVESNTPERIVHATSLAIMGAAVGTVTGMGIYCAVNPKACFGSCPTFYVNVDESEGEAGGLQLRAEGFSSAVAAALEERDVDHLGVVDPPAGDFTLVMANEALETHFLRSVEILSVPRPSDAELFHTRAGFVAVTGREAPMRCHGLGGDCLAAVRDADELEYATTTDGRDLASREFIELAFPARAAGSRPVLVLRARNTLLDTFLFYQGLAYMGAEAPRWILRADSEGADGPLVSLLRGFDRALGDIEVELWQDGEWRSVGGLHEYGPIARETQAVELPALT
ncbi:MAG: hypothetical protein KC457_07460, partial [Myxococcales bacterium]|nr:hypothetical protein [Myxococcales bacterium]